MANKSSSEIQIKDLDNWKRGQISYFSKSRLEEDALKTAYNVIFDYDAVVRPRGSFSVSNIPDIPTVTRRVAGGSPTVRTNLITNPSLEVGTAGWTSGSATISRDTIYANSGSGTLKVVTTGAWGYARMSSLPVVAGRTYTVSARVTTEVPHTAGTSNNTNVNLYITYVEGGSSTARITNLATVRTNEKMEGTFVVPEGKTVAHFHLYQYGDGTAWYDEIMFYEGQPMEYFDGDTADTLDTDYEWTGTPHNSNSTMGVYPLETVVPQPLGCDFAFKRPDNTEGLLNVFTDGVNAHLFVLSPTLQEWTKFSDIFDKDAAVSFAQVANVVVIGNGKDKFTYYDIESNTVKRLIKVADPLSTPTATTTGFGGTAALDYYYRVAFNGIGGHTMMTPAVKVTSSTIRDTWHNDGKSVAVSISAFTLDPNAQSWNVYVASVATGTGAPTDTEYLKIGEKLPIVQKQFQDTGEVTMLSSAPVENTTEGIVAWYFENISGRLWAIGNDGSTVYWGGDIGNELYFGSANGSDSYSINTGGIEKPMAITLGRDNAGTTCINLLTRTMAGQGAIWDVYATTNSITANGQTFSTGTYQFKKREGNDGTDAPFSVIHENNNAYYLSMEGFKSTGVKPNVSGIQSTDIISSAIRDRVLNLSQSNLSKTYAAYYDESLFWTVAYGAEKNNEIWVYDILHGGIWSVWRVSADSIFRWASTKKESPSLYIRQGNKLLRYYKNSRSHSDLGGVFESYIESGLIPFKKNNLEWVHLLKSVWQFDQSIGTVELTINIHSKNGSIIKVNELPFNNISATSAITSGWDALRVNETTASRGSWDNRSWDEVLANLLEFRDASDKKVSQKVRKNAAYISFKVRANTKDTYYELSHLSLLYTYIGVGIEFLSQKGVIKI